MRTFSPNDSFNDRPEPKTHPHPLPKFPTKIFSAVNSRKGNKIGIKQLDSSSKMHLTNKLARSFRKSLRIAKINSILTSSEQRRISGLSIIIIKS